MSRECSRNRKSTGSVESAIKDAIVTLNEIPGSTFSSVLDFVKIARRGTSKEVLLSVMKRMRKKRQLIQIKYWFRLPQKPVSKGDPHYHRVLPIPIPVASIDKTIGSRVQKRYKKVANETEQHTAATSSNSNDVDERRIHDEKKDVHGKSRQMKRRK